MVKEARDSLYKDCLLYTSYPEKFNNKTNGITFRRWLMECDPLLTEALEKWIGTGFKKDSNELEKLLAYENDEKVLEELTRIKKENKQALADWLWETQKVKISTDALYDIQSKRLHEYKRQQLNLLYLIHQYYEIKAGHLPDVYKRQALGENGEIIWTASVPDEEENKGFTHLVNDDWEITNIE